MYKLPALREDRRFLRDYKRALKDTQASGTTVVKKACRALTKRCKIFRSTVLGQLGSMGTSPYEYRSLDRSRNEIRLLTLEPGYGTRPLRCTLAHAFLDVTPLPLYETISYVCGNPARKSTTILHGHKVPVMATSEAALRRMRLRDKPRKLWIDSICINQDDKDERGHQVGLMYQIYTNTSRNLIWLGHYDNTLVESIAAMEAVLQEIAIETRDHVDFKRLLHPDLSGVQSFSKKPLSNSIDCLAFLRLVRIRGFRAYGLCKRRLLLLRACATTASPKSLSSAFFDRQDGSSTNGIKCR